MQCARTATTENQCTVRVESALPWTSANTHATTTMAAIAEVHTQSFSPDRFIQTQKVLLLSGISGLSFESPSDSVQLQRDVDSLHFKCMLGYFGGFHNPSNSDMDYRIFNTSMWSVCMLVHTGEQSL